MRITRKFRGQTLLFIDSAEHNKFLSQLSKTAENWYNDTSDVLFVNENTGELFLFCSTCVSEDNFVCSFADFNELDKFAQGEVTESKMDK